MQLLTNQRSSIIEELFAKSWSFRGLLCIFAWPQPVMYMESLYKNNMLFFSLCLPFRLIILLVKSKNPVKCTWHKGTNYRYYLFLDLLAVSSRPSSFASRKSEIAMVRDKTPKMAAASTSFPRQEHRFGGIRRRPLPLCIRVIMNIYYRVGSLTPHRWWYIQPAGYLCIRAIANTPENHLITRWDEGEGEGERKEREGGEGRGSEPPAGRGDHLPPRVFYMSFT